MNEETTKYRGYDIVVNQDEFPESPRDWDNLGTMVCWHNRYDLGDEQPKDCSPHDYMLATLHNLLPQVHDPKWLDPLEELLSKWWSDEDIPREDIEEEFDKHYVSLPLFLYDHSGITMNTTGFTCPWDSGQVGFIYVHRSKKSEIGKEHTLEEVLKAEVDVYDQYLRNDIWCYRVENKEGDDFDSCCGIYGYEYCMEQAREAVDYQVEEDRKRHQARLKQLIKHKVPLEHRV